MIYLYSGTPGSGKSYHATKLIYDSLLAGKNVICNFEINRDIVRLSTLGYIKYWLHKHFNIKFRKYNTTKINGRFYFVDNNYLTPKFLYDFAKKFHKSRKQCQTVVIIDECGIMFNPRTSLAPNRMAWLKFLSVHRHYFFDIILISQSDRMIDRQVRCLLEFDVKHRDGKNNRLFGRVLSLFTGGNFFMAIKYWYGIREKVGIEYLPINYRIFDMYDTFKIF